MKRLLLGCIYLLLFNLISWAGGKVIDLSKATDALEDRFLSYAPTAYHDGYAIFAYSDIPLIRLQVIIKDEVGQIISSETTSLLPKQPYTLYIGDMESGIYILELNDGKNEYRGFFEICE